MARYQVTVRSPLTPADAFAYMADLANFAEWDPGVTKVTQVVGDGAGPDAAFDVSVKGFVGDLTLRYETIEYEAPEHLLVVTESPLLISRDTVTVEAEGDGSLVTYDAVLELKGLFRLSDPLLGIAFKRIGDRAAKGLIKALEGARVSQ